MEWLIYLDGKQYGGRVEAATAKEAIKVAGLDHDAGGFVHATSWIPYTAKYKRRPKPEPDAGLGGGPDGTDGGDGGE